MKRFTAKSVIALTLGVCLVLALLWILTGTALPAAHATPLQSPNQRPLLQAGDVLTVCPAVVGTCPFTNIQAAVDAAHDGDVIKVAAGAYTGVQSRPAPPGYVGPAEIDQVVYISKTVMIQGGYTTTNWVTSYPITQPTTLDAQGQGRVLFITGDTDPHVEGLRITGGDADGLGGTVGGYDVGGGIYIVTATAIINDNQLFNNTAYHGGGGYIFNSDATLNNNTITTNTVSYNYAHRGGGLYLYNSAATLNDNIVSGNIGGSGGGLILIYSDATLNRNTISANTSDSGGGGALIWMSDAILDDNIVQNNYAGDGGGGLFLNWSNAILSRNIISSNVASQWGGGVYLGSGAPTLRENVIMSNTVNYGDGGGLYFTDSNATLVGNIVAFNTIRDDGFYSGSGLCFEISSSSHLLHNTIARNSGGDGSGIYLGNSNIITLTNTILVGHETGIYAMGDNTARLTATLWGTGTWANTVDWGGLGTITVGTINIWDDPAFVNPDVGNYHIGSGSAAIDAGVDAGVTIDIDGEPRPAGMGYDIGADEYHLPSLKVSKQVYPNTVQGGASLTYTIRIVNTSSVDLHATITDTLPLSVTLNETSGGTLALPGGTVGITWTALIPAPGGTWEEMIVVTVADDYDGPLTNLVEVTTEEGAMGSAIAIVNAYKVYLPLVLRNP